MARHGLCMVCAVLLLAGAGCSPPPKLSPEQLVAALKGAGYEVTERNRLHPGSQGAEYGFVLDIDFRPVTAWQFGSPPKAALWASSNAGAFAVDYWAFAYADSVTAHKIRASLGAE